MPGFRHVLEAGSKHHLSWRSACSCHIGAGLALPGARCHSPMRDMSTQGSVSEEPLQGLGHKLHAGLSARLSAPHGAEPKSWNGAERAFPAAAATGGRRSLSRASPPPAPCPRPRHPAGSGSSPLLAAASAARSTQTAARSARDARAGRPSSLRRRAAEPQQTQS